MDALVVSSHPMALFICPCSRSTSLERVSMSVLVGVSDCGVVGMLTTLGVSDTRVREGEWLIGTVSSGIAAHGDTCWEVATSLSAAKTGLSGPNGSSTPMVSGALRAIDVGFLGVVSPEAGLEVSSIT